jgi:hypothetical protein
VATEAVAVLPTSEDRIRAALWFAEHGFGVFSCWSARDDGTCRCPAGGDCDSPGKHPVTQNGFKDATRDPARIRILLSAGSEPNYGLVPPPGVFAWDVDGEDLLRLAEHEEHIGPLPATLETLTAHGRHLFLRWPDGFPRPIHRMFGLVTRWGSGELAGYVIGPRSVHRSGAIYTPAGIPEIATLPDSWAQAVLDDQVRPRIRVSGRSDPADVRVGGRHDWLRDTARHYAGVVRDPDALFAAVWAENRKLAEPKTEEAVRRAIGDVLERFGPDPVDPGTDEVVAPGEPGLLVPAQDDALFPPPPAPVALTGLLGECVAALSEGTDASPVGILASLLAFCGALMPARAYLHAHHTSSPYLALVGRSSIGRKGTAMFRARDALGLAVGMDVVNRVRLNGLASGEALVRALLDRQRDPSTYGNPTGVLFEEEYATFLAASSRDGSTLDSRMRAAFDGMSLSHRKVAETVTVGEPYWLSGLVAITPAELQDRVQRASFHNGSGNRWLWLPVVQRDVIAEGDEPILPLELTEALVEAHRACVRVPPVLGRGPGSGELVSEYDRFLRAETIGLAADMTRRFGIIAFRVAMVHAAVERSPLVTVDHVLRGIALTEYARAGLEWTFGEALGDGLATLLLRHLKEEEVLTNGTISKYLIRDPQKRQAAVDELQRLGLAEVVRIRTGGRTRSELRLVPGKGDFRDFRALLGGGLEADVSNSAGNARKRSDAGAEGAQKVRGSARKSDREVIDTETGEVMAGEARWASPCRDYRAHQDHHRNTTEGWVCLACEQGGAS